MRNEKKDRVLLPGETKDCVCHCGICKKRNLSQNFKYDEYRERFKCPSCGRYIEYLYANKVRNVRKVEFHKSNLFFYIL